MGKVKNQICIYGLKTFWLQVYQKTERLVQQGHNISIRWISAHNKIEGNERADRAAKEAASEGKVRTARWTSLAHVKRKLQKRESCRFIPGMSKKPGSKRAISEVSIFLVSKHRFTPSSAKLKSSMYHGYIS